MRIPLVDLGAQYRAHKSEFDHAIQQVIDSCAFIGGAPVEEFEKSFASVYGVRNCIPCANGTDAIYIALRMLGVGEGHEVITTASSWIATSESISETGARPVFVDVDRYHLIDPDRVAAAVSPRTRAIIPVHLYGQAADMRQIMSVAKENGVWVIEDCAQAHFAEDSGQRVGTIGDVGTFSFYPGKNLGAWGDAGALVTNNDDLALSCRKYANHGSLRKHDHEIEGINSRLDGIQAAILSVKLKFIDEWTAARRHVANFYDESLENVGDIETPGVRSGATHVYHVYAIETAHRDALKRFMEERGIMVGIHYPTPLPLLPAYRHLGLTSENFPQAARQQSRILSLPIYPEMTADQMQYVVDTIREYFVSR